MVNIFSCSTSLRHYKIHLYSKVLPIIFQLFLCVQKILMKCFCFYEKHVENKNFHMNNQDEILNCSSNWFLFAESNEQLLTISPISFVKILRMSQHFNILSVGKSCKTHIAPGRSSLINWSAEITLYLWMYGLTYLCYCNYNTVLHN